MQLAFAEPCLPLRPFIGGYYLVSSDVPYLQDVARADIGQLRLFLDGSGRLAPGHDTAPLVTPRALSGPSTYASEFALIGPVRMFGIALLPAAWGMIVPVSAARLRNQICDGQDLFGTALETFRDQLINCQTLPEMATFADRFLAAQLAPAAARSPRFAPPFGAGCARSWHQTPKNYLPIFPSRQDRLNGSRTIIGASRRVPFRANMPRCGRRMGSPRRARPRLQALPIMPMPRT